MLGCWGRLECDVAGCDAVPSLYPADMEQGCHPRAVGPGLERFQPEMNQSPVLLGAQAHCISDRPDCGQLHQRGLDLPAVTRVAVREEALGEFEADPAGREGRIRVRAKALHRAQHHRRIRGYFAPLWQVMVANDHVDPTSTALRDGLMIAEADISGDDDADTIPDRPVGRCDTEPVAFSTPRR